MDAPAPAKGKGALLHAPIPKLYLLQTTAPPALLQTCAHLVTRTERLPKSHLHFARLTCALCGRHLRWLPRPETIERERFNGLRLARLAMCEGLSSWEREFVRDVSKRPKLSPKQQAIIARLVTQYLEEETP
jgi:hypothetical protein